jgi:hypothetical protein
MVSLYTIRVMRKLFQFLFGKRVVAQAADADIAVSAMLIVLSFGIILVIATCF